MERPKSAHGQASLFQVYLRLRPPIQSRQDAKQESFLSVELPDSDHDWPTHITVQPPSDVRKRAVERFAFTKVFEEAATQLDVFQESGMPSLINAVLLEDRDSLVATLGVTGSGKSHTILGSKSQRGITQMSLEIIFRSLGSTIRLLEEDTDLSLIDSLSSADPSEAQLYSAEHFLETIYGDPSGDRGRFSRAQTPMTTRSQTPMDSFIGSNSSRRPQPPRLSTLPQDPDTSNISIPIPDTEEHAVLISMYEVYNDRIFDLLSPASQTTGTRAANNQKDRRRPLLFKPTERSADRKVVAGLRKIVCSTHEEALMVLETGLVERRVTGTGSNSVSSRSHGFFCVEVKRKVNDKRFGHETWTGNAFTIVDLAGSERARNAKTAGATLAEAGKINESLMYLGQCLQMQTDLQDGNKALVPFRQCKLTELLFSNSFPSSNHSSSNLQLRNTQKAVMLVMADPLGDFNATSQMLRYSALAREVTVPRIPSITSTILSTTTSASAHRNNATSSSQAAIAEQLEAAALEIAHVTDEYEALAVRFSEEEIERIECELKLKAAEERCLMIDQEVREECWAEMEERMEEERRRWQAAWDEQSSKNEDHLDMKIDLLSREIKIHEDPAPHSTERVKDLETENEALRRKVEQLERELYSRSPTKKAKSKKNTIPGRFDSMDYSFIPANESDIENTQVEMKKLNLGPLKPSPLAQMGKPKKLTTRQWDLAPEDSFD